ncbi:dienelactone hydrolase family protein [Rubellicoccus peritrichatus]|uniref:Dienelactone hydrolase family protein n=1 Tax=Rubellicoccus peritrichatus TaxID=3080537 RepID=A0AAQ3QX42_9BACT|nr:dienelactone hydrolase family protein [Puniceicoccus sp. CR14]WOO43293.1 dienelactone hydrolase family protein [Puniceicoccus sp. CR14]
MKKLLDNFTRCGSSRGLRVYSTSLFLIVTASFCSAFTFEDVFFDVPQSLLPNPIPEPTAQLLALQNYPDDDQRLTLVGRLYLPDANVYGPGPYPAVVVMHGSGGVWSNDLIANGLSSQFRKWGELLSGMGYACLCPDSYNPRGIPGNFSSRRPHYDPAIDDDLCSPNYERPKDVIAALTYLQSRADIDSENTALIGFSHGAQTCINAILDVSVDLGVYDVSYIDYVQDEETELWEEVSTDKVVDSPVRIPSDIPFPKLCALYYGGGSHYGYHGSANDTGAGRYMFDRRTNVLMFHGTDDFLMDVDDPEVTPMTGNLYPIKQALASSAQAAALGVDDPLKHHFLLDLVDHSFDGETIADEQDWNTNAESADQKAKRLCREEVLKWLEALLQAVPQLTIENDPLVLGDVDLSSPTNTRLNYQWSYSDDLLNWHSLGSAFDGDGSLMTESTDLGQPGQRFFRLDYAAIEPPIDDPDNDGFFRSYADFSY